jgi:hypothetical protein
MEQAGAIPSTVKTLEYELRRSVAAPRTKALLETADISIPFLDPEDLPDLSPNRS